MSSTLSKTLSACVILSLASSAESRLRHVQKEKDTRTLQGNCVFPMENISTSSCDYESILAATGCDESTLWSYLGVTTGPEAEDKVQELCESAYGASDIFPFEKVTNKGRQFDLEFFNGGGKLNNLEKEAQTLADQTMRLSAVADNVVSSQIISWPYDLPGLDNCPSQAVTCCWTADKYDVGDGTCDSPTGCIDEEPADNTDVCSVDMSKSRRAARTHEGFAYYPGDSEGSVNCQGFAWGDEDEAFRGNALFYLAMQKGFMENGYVRNVPGAPMCGCVESMPVVSKSGCSKTMTDLTWNFSVDGGSLELELANMNVSFEDCGEDLADHYTTRFGSSLGDYITGECDDKTASGFKKSTTSWTPIVGIGMLKSEQTMTEDDLRSIVNADPNNLKIIRRRCKHHCVVSHRDIYYKRLTPIPEGTDLINILKEYWYEVDGNIWHTDFELYSHYSDAVEGKNPWQYCNFGDRNVGFPRDCGPEHHQGGQWNTIPGPITGTNHYGQPHVAFYVED